MPVNNVRNCLDLQWASPGHVCECLGLHGEDVLRWSNELINNLFFLYDGFISNFAENWFFQSALAQISF
jgi:hypothetical protein